MTRLRTDSRERTSAFLSTQALESDVLSQLFAAHSVFPVLGSKKQVCDFAAHALIGVPGTLWCRVCLCGVSGQAGCVPQEVKCLCQAHTPDLRDHEGDGWQGFGCQLSELPDTVDIPLETSDEHFGSLALGIDSIESFRPYEPFLFNFANYLAISLENRSRKELLEEANRVLQADIQKRKQVEAEIRKHKDRLEELVAERTNELIASNESLKQEIEARIRTEGQNSEFIDKLEVQNAELERFAYTVSHDLKTPLITIKGYLGLWEQDVAKGNEDQAVADARQIADAADKMYGLLDDLLKLTQIGHQAVSSESVATEELVADVVQLLGHGANPGVTIDVAPGIPAIHGDPTRLREVFQNLIENAIKYIGAQPNPCIEIGIRGEGSQQVCFVRDNGIGIEPEFQSKVFGLFDQLDPNAEGTGVGLAIVKRIVESHGGEIWIESDGPGTGSTFCFTLASPGS